MFSAYGGLLMVLCAIFLQLRTFLSIPTPMQQTEATRADTIFVVPAQILDLSY